MQISGFLHAPQTGIALGGAARRVEPVDAVAAYTASSSSYQARGQAADAALEGEFLRSAGRRHAHEATARPVFAGTLVNAARAVSTYAQVANASAPDDKKRPRLDLRA